MQLTDQQWAQLHERAESLGYVNTVGDYKLSPDALNAIVQLGLDLATAKSRPDVCPTCGGTDCVYECAEYPANGY